MTLTIAPKSLEKDTARSVGIFWRVASVLVVDRSALDAAEPYGDCLTHAGGHYERWEEWRAMGGARLVALGYPVAICSSEYDDWPRGRIVYETSAKQFVVYADKRLQSEQTVSLILSAFGLAGSPWRLMSDAHYR